MRNSLIWRGVLIAFLAVVSAWAIYPLREKLNLGLDLQGGIHLVLGVQTQDAVKAETDKDIESLRREALDKGLASIDFNRTSDTTFEATGVPADKDVTIGEIANTQLRGGWDWRRSADKLEFVMKAKTEQEIRNSAVEQAKQTIDNRINQFGVAEPMIARQGAERIVVQLPGVDDPDRVKRLIKSTAFLEFRLVDFPSGGNVGPSSREEVVAHYGGGVPSNVEIVPEDVHDDQGHVIGQRFYGLDQRRVITGRDLKSAHPSEGQFGQPVVQFNLSAQGAKLFGEATGANVGRGLAIVLDGRVVSAPRINSRITDSGIIEGSFTQQEVQDLVTTLRSGALPAGIVYLEDRTVGPALGQDSINSGLKAGLAGAGLVVLFMIVWYKLAGMNAVLSLGLNLLLIFASLSYFGATLTLPGICGIVLTIGMAVDANVLVFERIREELRAGKNARTAIEAGFSRALSSVVDTHLTTLISALFLFQFGTGPVRGFAVTLSIGVFGTLFTAIFVSRWLFDLYYGRAQRATRISI